MTMRPADPRPLGAPLTHWQPPAAPGPMVLEGLRVRLEPLEAERHAADLFTGFSGHDHLWDYMASGPFSSASGLHRWVKDIQGRDDPLFFAICDRDTGHALGLASYLRITPEAGVIEIGNICFSPAIQRHPSATEAMYLLMQWAFDAGYRRYEWKCNALNLPSRRAAQRLGFSYEGLFRNHMVVKGRNRDTAWFAITDYEWPALKEAFAAWLAPSNFDAQGRQRERLTDLTGLVRQGADPAL